MSLAQINWHPRRKELRTFAIIALIAAFLIALLLWRLRGLGIQWATVIISSGIVIFFSSFLSHKLTRIIYLGFILVTLPIGLLMSFLLLAFFYFGILTPLACIFHLIGRDPLHRKCDSEAESYWITHRKPDNLDRYYHQF